MSSILILGLNGHVGQAAARAFIAAGWSVTGFGRSNRHAIQGLDFFKGDATDASAVAAAIAPHDIVFNGLNLPYDKWFDGRAEAQLQGVITAMGTSGKTMLFPGNIYNYATSQRRVAPDSPQHPARPRGEIRVRMEDMLKAAAGRGDIQVVVLRAGDFYGPGSANDWYDQMIVRELGKGKVALANNEIGHAWAYLPDLARAFVRLEELRKSLSRFENFNFAGHFLTAKQIHAALERAAGRSLKRVAMPWGVLSIIGVFNPLMRELVKMRYLWDNPLELVDPRLDAILGDDFGTPYPEAIAATAAPFLESEKLAA